MANYAVTEHEYRYRESIDGVLQAFTAWAPCTAEMDNLDGTVTIPVGDRNVAVGDLQVRVMALNGNNPGEILANATAFTKVPITPAAPTNGIVDDTADTFKFTLALK